jgi:hypothetical protein
MEPVSRIVSEDEWRRVQSHLDGATLDQLVQTEGKGTRQSCAYLFSFTLFMSVMARAYLRIYSGPGFLASPPSLSPISKVLLAYLFTCVVIPHGPGMTSQGTSAPGCTSLASDGHACIPLSAAQLVCSQLFVCLPKGLAFFALFTSTNFVAAMYHSYAEELSSNPKPAMNSNVHWICSSAHCPDIVFRHLKPSIWL